MHIHAKYHETRAKIKKKKFWPGQVCLRRTRKEFRVKFGEIQKNLIFFIQHKAKLKQ